MFHVEQYQSLDRYRIRYRLGAGAVEPVGAFTSETFSLA